MISALVYLQVQSFLNRTRVRLRRLKQPKYLFGAIIGGLYFYFYFFRFLFQGGGRGRNAQWLTDPENVLIYETLVAAGLLVLAFLAWVMPQKRAALTFTEAEIAFLFPAPISRRGLIHYKLLRSQVAIIFAVLLLTLLTNRVGGRAWIHAAGWWVLLSTISLHGLASSFTRTLLLDRGITTWQRRGVVLCLAGAVLGLAIWWARREIPGFDWPDSPIWRR